MPNIKSCATMAFFGTAGFGVPITLLIGAFVPGSRFEAFAGLGLFVVGASVLAAGVAARVCAALKENPRIGFLALTMRGSVAGTIAGLAMLPLPELLHFDGGIYLLPLYVGMAVGGISVVGFHLLRNHGERIE